MSMTRACPRTRGCYKRLAGPAPPRERPRWQARSKIAYYYDLTYHYMKRHWIIFCAVILATIVSGSLAIGWAFRLKTFNIADPGSMAHSIVKLSANIVNVDPIGQEMILDWVIKYDCESIGCPDANIYFDSNILRTDSGSTTNSQVQTNVKPDPIFTINGGNVLAMRNNTDRRSSSLTFRTNVAISNANTHRTLQSYPFDKYDTELVLFAEEAITNNSVSIAIVKTTGIAVGFSVQLHNTTNDEDNFGTVIKNIEVTRGAVVRLYAIFIVLVIWLVTLTFMATCVICVFFGKGVSSGVLVLPMGTLFAFTQLRSTLPGAPVGFGAVIDFMGLLPCLAILTFCSVFMTAVFLHRNPEKDAPGWQRAKLRAGRRSSSYPV
ncbi:hypothetical protein TRAPUB_4304 [Trametes pubescens]|uniref:Transmembrane protein n=1 Tax=Trametes pubescens TaxID=154538 RepID=A0A1M2W7F5_TRAPU|nr:hypothetical protein TRAPUB_4304 [Trametes pubescens]